MDAAHDHRHQIHRHQIHRHQIHRHQNLILDAALNLFNERGTAKVTTNHIAEALGMSPGNLYYHFRNKAEIVRGLFARIAAEWATNGLPAERSDDGSNAGRQFRDPGALPVLVSRPDVAAQRRSGARRGVPGQS